VDDLVLQSQAEIRVDYRFFRAGERDLSQALREENDRLNRAEQRLREIRRARGVVEDEEDES
jgi:hypothetical protein